MKMNILDDSYGFLSEYVAASEAQLTAMTLYAFGSHALDAWVTFGRMLFTSEQEASGKTLAMTATTALCANPMDTEGTQFALQAAMLAASNSPEVPVPTLWRDEISDITGRNGMSGGKNPIMKYLRKGYKRGATDMVSRAGVEERFSIFTPFLMTGLRTAVPRDVRSRCIVIRMSAGVPRRYYDVREAEVYASALQQAISRAVRSKIPELRNFRARGIHPKLVSRRLEVWEPLLAIAYVLGGQRWLNMGISAFTELALDQSDTLTLTPRQQVIKDVAGYAAQSSDAFISGWALADELSRNPDPLYADRTATSVACLIRDSVPVQSQQRRLPDGNRVRGYPREALLAAWEAERPDQPEDSEVPPEEDPFAVTGGTGTDSADDASATP